MALAVCILQDHQKGNVACTACSVCQSLLRIQSGAHVLLKLPSAMLARSCVKLCQDV